MTNDKVIYFLTEDDVQTVANDELERNLTSEEIDIVKELIAEKLNWYDAIAESIQEKIN